MCVYIYTRYIYIYICTRVTGCDVVFDRALQFVVADKLPVVVGGKKALQNGYQASGPRSVPGGPEDEVSL